MLLYKLTNSEGYTRGATYWEVGVTHTLMPCQNPKLCSGDVFHAYTSPLLAALLNHVHADYCNPQCFTCEGTVAVSDGTKVGCFSLEVLGTFSLPQVTRVQAVAFHILCGLQVCKIPRFVHWAERWLCAADRSFGSARTVAGALYAILNGIHNAAYCAVQNVANYTRYTASAAGYAAAAKNSIDFQGLAEKAME